MIRSLTPGVCLLLGACSTSIGSAAVETVRGRAEVLRDALDQFEAQNDASGDWPFFKNETLHAIYRKSSKDGSLLRQLLEEPAVEEDVKILALRLHQCVSFDEILAVIQHTNGLYLRKAVSAKVLRTAILPGAEWGTTLSLRFEDARVERLLGELATDPRSDPLVKQAIQSVLSGKQAAFIVEYRDQSPLPRWPCD